MFDDSILGASPGAFWGGLGCQGKFFENLRAFWGGALGAAFWGIWGSILGKHFLAFLGVQRWHLGTFGAI